MAHKPVFYALSLKKAMCYHLKQDADVGEWVDAMMRVEDLGVPVLNALFRWGIGKWRPAVI